MATEFSILSAEMSYRCDLENNLVEKGSIAKINLVLGCSMEKNNLVSEAGIPKINLESKGVKTYKKVSLMNCDTAQRETVLGL